MFLQEEAIESQEDQQPMPYQRIEEEEATSKFENAPGRFEVRRCRC